LTLFAFDIFTSNLSWTINILILLNRAWALSKSRHHIRDGSHRRVATDYELKAITEVVLWRRNLFNDIHLLHYPHRESSSPIPSKMFGRPPSRTSLWKSLLVQSASLSLAVITLAFNILSTTIPCSSLIFSIYLSIFPLAWSYLTRLLYRYLNGNRTGMYPDYTGASALYPPGAIAADSSFSVPSTSAETSAFPPRSPTAPSGGKSRVDTLIMMGTGTSGSWLNHVVVTTKSEDIKRTSFTYFFAFFHTTI
jgi:hypothetical protein